MKRWQRQSYQGIPASPGIAQGQAYLLQRGPIRIERHSIPSQQVEAELLRLEQAIGACVGELQQLNERFKEHGIANQPILAAHLLLLQDPTLKQEASALIQSQQLNASWAVSRVISRFRHLFEQMSDPYLKERRSDIDFAGERLIRMLQGHHQQLDEQMLQQGNYIVLAQDLSPVDTALLAGMSIAGFVTSLGGRTSHTSILARSLEVPAVVGCQELLQEVRPQDLILINGLTGQVVVRPEAQELSEAMEQQRTFLHFQQQKTSTTQAFHTRDGVSMTLLANIERPSEVKTAMERGSQGVGLYRTEFLYLSQHHPPSEEHHYQAYCAVLQASGEQWVTIRTMDIGGDKQPQGHMSQEANPALGMRAIRYSLRHPHVFANQLAAILRVGLLGNVQMLLPMISDLSELLATKKLLQRVESKLQEQHIPYQTQMPIGVMIEVPSAVWIADVLAAHCDFFAVGTNDLTQYTLACDRNNTEMAYLYNAIHPAMLRSLAHLEKISRQHNRPISICGEIAGDMLHLPVLLGLGFTTLSMHPGAFSLVVPLLQQLEQKACKTLVEQLMAMTDAQHMQHTVYQFLRQQVPNIPFWQPPFPAHSTAPSPSIPQTPLS